MANPYDRGSIPNPDDLWSVDPNTIAEEWLADHDALSLDDLATVASAFAREVGDPARAESDDGVVEDDRLRVADADAFGRFAREYDVALLEPADAIPPEYGYLYGYTPNANTAEETGVPLLVCLPGPRSAAVDWLEAFSAAVAELPRFGIVRP